MADRVVDGLAIAAASGGPGSADSVRAHAHQLIATANELITLAKALETRSMNGCGDGDGAPPERDQLLALARETYRVRRMRSQIFGDSDLFGEPAWDMLLDLFIATGDGKRVPVTSACIGAAVPTTTALRWLTMLEDRGLVVREHDTHDARRIFVRLTSEAEAKMSAYFTKSTLSRPRALLAGNPPREAIPDDPAPFLLGK